MITVHLSYLGLSRNDAKEHLYKITRIDGDVRVFVSFTEFGRVGDVVNETKVSYLLDKQIVVVTT